MKIIEFGMDSKRQDTAFKLDPLSSNTIQLFMFQTGTLKTK